MVQMSASPSTSCTFSPCTNMLRRTESSMPSRRWRCPSAAWKLCSYTCSKQYMLREGESGGLKGICDDRSEKVLAVTHRVGHNATVEGADMTDGHPVDGLGQR